MPDAAPGRADLIERLVSLCKQRGFVFPSSEIYGGVNAAYDYGPLGGRLPPNNRQRRWRAKVDPRDYGEGIQDALVINPQVWVGHGLRQKLTGPPGDCQA